MFINLKTPVIIGHRGASLYAPENTLAAFKLAIKQQVDAIEFDVKLSADQQVVVIHDQTVDRTTTNGHGQVSRLSLMELKRLDAGGWFSSKFAGEQIPTLEEVLDLVGEKIPMNIELTNYTSPGDALVDKVVELINKKGMEDQIYFSSFLSRNLIKARKLIPECGIGYLTYAGAGGIAQKLFQKTPRGINSINPARQTVSQRMVNKEHQKGRRILVYTVNEVDEMRKLFNLRVDGIFTDDPVTGRMIAAEYRGK